MPRRQGGPRRWAGVVATSLVAGLAIGVVGTLAFTDDEEGSSADGTTATTASDGTTSSTVVEKGRRQCIAALDDAATAIDLIEVGVESVQDLDAEALRAVVEQLQPMTPSLRMSLEECRDHLVG